MMSFYTFLFAIFDHILIKLGQRYICRALSHLCSLRKSPKCFVTAFCEREKSAATSAFAAVIRCILVSNNGTARGIAQARMLVCTTPHILDLQPLGVTSNGNTRLLNVPSLQLLGYWTIFLVTRELTMVGWATHEIYTTANMR
jgi:hypothetical protein